MKRLLFLVLGLVSLAGMNFLFSLSVSAQPPKPARGKPQTRQIQGQIVKMDARQFVVKTSANEQFTVHVRPQTKFLLKDKVVQLTDLRVGANVTVNALVEGDQPFAESVVLVEEEANPQETLIEGEIVRVVAQDQVIVRTAERKEVIVFVDPRTTFLLENRTAKFADLRVGANVHANVHIRDGRHMARQIVVPPRRR